MLKLARSKTAERSPERVALADAIARHTAATADLATATAAQQRAARLIADLEAAKTTAERELEAAKAAQVEAITRGATPTPLRGARAALLDLDDEIDAARQAHQALAANVAEARDALADWRSASAAKVREAALAVIYVETQALRARVATARREYFVVLAQLRWLTENQSGHSYRTSMAPDYDAAVAGLLLSEPPDATELSAEALRPFESALAALMADADAALPAAG